MAGLEWEFSDPVMEGVSLSRDEQGLWIVGLRVREQHEGSLGQKVIRARMIDQGRFLGREIASVVWPVTQTREERTASETTLLFHTGTNDYPDKTKIEFEFVDQV
jgi:hypothetical protein